MPSFSEIVVACLDILYNRNLTPCQRVYELKRYLREHSDYKES